MDRGRLSMISCDAGRSFAKRVVSALREEVVKEAKRGTLTDEAVSRHLSQLSLRESREVWFANGEVKTEIHENIRGDDVYIFQSPVEPCREHTINDNLMALLTAVNAAWQSDADTVSVVMPLYPYSRQERKRRREGITAALVARCLEASGAIRVITLDIHAEAVVCAFRAAKLENLHSSRVIIEFLRGRRNFENTVVVSPDAGGAERARFYAKLVHTEFALIDKVRDYSRPGTIAEMRLVGYVEGRNALIVDDMIDTGGSIIRAVQTLKDNGALDIDVCCTHPLFSGSAIEKLDKACGEGLINSVIGTDSIMWGDELREKPWYQEVSTAPLFASVILHINQKLSVSDLLS